MQLSTREQAQIAELAALSHGLLQQGRAAEAKDVLLTLDALSPGDAEILKLLGDALFELGRHGEAAESYARAGRLNPKLSAHHMNLHHAHILRGEVSQAWKAYEWRLAERGGRVSTRAFPIPQWRGEPIEGKTILVHAEQGFGDMIQFVRYLSTLKALGAHVVLDMFAPLLRLFQGLEHVDVLVGPGDPAPAADVHTPLMSLPLAFDLGGVIPLDAETPYLHADPKIVERWSRRLPSGSLKVGIVASGNPGHQHDSRRSIPLDVLAQGLPPDATYVLIQQQVRDSDLSALASRPDIVQVGEALEDYADTAGLCAALDVVVSVDTSVVHLAGALGRPTWLLLPHFPDWRWEMEGDRTRWYPTMRLFRQPRTGDWSAVASAVRNEIMLRMAQGEGHG